MLYRTIRHFLISFSLILAISACTPADQPNVEDQTESTQIFTADISNTPIPAIPSPLAILLATPESDLTLASEIEAILIQFGQQNGLDVKRQENLNPAEIPKGLKIVVVLAPASGITELAAAAPKVQLLVIGSSEIQAGGNITTLGTGNPEHLGFIAGYTAAIITEDWRVGVLSVSDTSEGQLISESFMIGARFFCGLCLPLYPPYGGYPLFAERPAGSSADQWRAAADQLLNNAVTTIYVSPGVADNSLLEYLAQAGVSIIGSTIPPENLRSSWVATLTTDLQTSFWDTLPSLIAGQGGYNVNLPIEFQHVNFEMLSSGKITHILEIQVELIAGFIFPLAP